MVGDAGYRSPYLSHAKRALYHLSYIPCVGDHVTNKSLFPLCSTFQRLCGNARQNGSHSPALSRTFDSSVGRAVDCRCNTWEQISIGHWFKSGSKEDIFFQASHYFLGAFSPKYDIVLVWYIYCDYLLSQLCNDSLNKNQEWMCEFVQIPLPASIPR